MKKDMKATLVSVCPSRSWNSDPKRAGGASKGGGGSMGGDRRGGPARAGKDGGGASTGGEGWGGQPGRGWSGWVFFFFFIFFWVLPPFLGGGWSGIATGYLHSSWRKKNRTHQLQATKDHKNKNYNKCKTMAPSTLHDDQRSLVLVLSVIPKYHSPSSIRSHLHQNLYLGHVHIKFFWHIYRLHQGHLEHLSK